LSPVAPLHVIERPVVDQLLEVLAARGYTVIGPTVRDQAIVYDEIGSTKDMPVGLRDEQDGGHYRLVAREDQALFGYAVGPQSWKQLQLPSSVVVWRAKLQPSGELTELETPAQTERYALIGARSCELSAMNVLERVLLGGRHPDPADSGRIKDAFIVAVQCAQAGGTCFCVSMKTGPVAESGFDLALTEVIEDARHYFVVEVGSQRGADVLEELPHARASDAEGAAAGAVHEQTAASMGRELDMTGIKELLYDNYQHPRWAEVADRCLACGNCTMVCPTCFCTTVEDVTDLTGEHVERTQSWDSCFTVDYSHIHGGSVRNSTRSRYRQWMTHKLATWWDQFGTSGCVGCGRCITWCPVGIDITEEAAAIRATEEAPHADHR
jgi:sulfhydrogenase subunit beta (sulfur reductase)